MAYVRVQSEQYPSSSAPQSIVRSVSGGIATARSSAWGSAECSPAATIEGKLGACAPEAAHRELERDRHLALGATDDALLQHLGERSVCQLSGGADARYLLGVLDLAQGAHQSSAAHQLPALGQHLAQAPVLLDGRDGLVEPQPSDPSRAGLQCADGRLQQLDRDDLALERRRYLLGGLGCVAEVGEEQWRAGALGRDQHQPVGPCEAGEVAHVHRPAHQQHV